MARKPKRKAARGAAVKTPSSPRLSRKSASRGRRLSVSARQLVYSVLRETLGDLPLNDDMKLSKLGFDKPSLAGVAAKIRARGVPVDTGAIQRCTTVGQIVKVVAAVKK